MVGHDYRLALPSMLDTFLHYRVNGLSIQWYTPSFGGGLPVFPNPNSIQFSLLSLLTLLFQPLQSVMISSVIYILAGGLAVYFLFIRVLKLHWTASVLGAIFFSANGFIIQRVAVGHLGYQVFPLIPVLIFSLLDSSISWMIRGNNYCSGGYDDNPSSGLFPYHCFCIFPLYINTHHIYLSAEFNSHGSVYYLERFWEGDWPW